MPRRDAPGSLAWVRPTDPGSLGKPLRRVAPRGAASAPAYGEKPQPTAGGARAAQRAPASEHLARFRQAAEEARRRASPRRSRNLRREAQRAGVWGVGFYPPRKTVGLSVGSVIANTVNCDVKRKR